MSPDPSSPSDSDQQTQPGRPAVSGWPSFFEPFRHVGQAVANLFSPSADASHSDDGYEIRVELPGVAEKDVEVSVHDGVLTISGEKKEERTERDEERKIYFTERSFGSFQRSFRIPDSVDQEAIQADFEKGVLTVALPKKAETKGEKKVVAVKSR